MIEGWSLRFDLRSHDGDDLVARYRAALEMATLADDAGATAVLVSEHHGVEDGYLPSPLVVAAALGAVTRDVRLVVSALIVGLHDPVRAAEDTIVADVLSAGRLAVVAALGYRRQDFDVFGVDMSQRVDLMERTLPVYLAAMRGEPVDAGRGPHTITPRPAQRPSPPVLVGGAVPAAARRAAALGDGFWPMRHDDALESAYRDACAELGRPTGAIVRPPSASAVFVAEDPERWWAAIGPWALRETSSYASWAQASGAPTSYGRRAGQQVGGDLDSLRRSGAYEVLTPEECTERLRGGGSMFLHPLIGGCPLDLAWEGLQLFVDRVAPAVRARAQTDRG